MLTWVEGSLYAGSTMSLAAEELDEWEVSDEEELLRRRELSLPDLPDRIDRRRPRIVDLAVETELLLA